MIGLEKIEIVSFCVGLAVFTSYKFLVCCRKWKSPLPLVWQGTPFSIQRNLMEPHRLVYAFIPFGAAFQIIVQASYKTKESPDQAKKPMESGTVIHRVISTLRRSTSPCAT